MTIKLMLLILAAVFITLFILGRMIFLSRYHDELDDDDFGLNWMERQTIRNIAHNSEFIKAMETEDYATVRAMLKEAFPDEIWPWEEQENDEDEENKFISLIKQTIILIADKLELFYLYTMKCCYYVVSMFEKIM